MKQVLPGFLVSLILLSPLRGQESVIFYATSGQLTAADGTLDGWTVADHYGGSNYNGFVGHLGLVFEDQDEFVGITETPEGTFRGDTGDVFAGDLGLLAFCIDSETPFQGSGVLTGQTYAAHSLAQAEARYLAESVDGYSAGGLRRAAYIMESFYAVASTFGNLGAATMQSAIWEVLTDSSPSLGFGSGNYYLRNNTGNRTSDQRANQMIQLASTWFAQAQSDNWGGESYSPETRVVFWLDPLATSFNQSVITLNPVFQGEELFTIPEPSSAAMLAFATIIGLGRRRRRVAK